MMRSLRLALSLSIQQHLLMTCCYVAVNSRRRSLSYANAGHPYPYHYRPATGALTRMQALDPILGALDVDAVEFEERTLEFQPGDFLVMYSDGLRAKHSRALQGFRHRCPRRNTRRPVRPPQTRAAGRRHDAGRRLRAAIRRRR
jgi:serine phosphatase RsbU (regulator of sigma subunit)